MRREEDLDSLAMIDCWVSLQMYVETLTQRKRRKERQIRPTGKHERRAVDGIKNVHTSRTRGSLRPLHGPQAFRWQIDRRRLSALQCRGFFPDRGV